MTVAAVILGAGFSRRLGRPKQTLILGGQSLLMRTVAVAQAARLRPIIAVVQEDCPLIPKLQAADVISVPNVEAAEGMASSVRLGVRVALMHSAVGVVLMACDQPALTPTHLAHLTVDLERMAGSRYAGQIGGPAYFPASTYDRLLTLRGDVGARALLRDAYAVSNEALALDIDTEEDLRLAERAFT